MNTPESDSSEHVLAEAIERFFSDEASPVDERLIYETKLEKDVEEYMRRE